MCSTPLKQNKEKSAKKSDIIQDVSEKNWITVLSANSIKLLVLFYGLQQGGEMILGDYDLLMKKSGLSRGTISTSLLELEMFGFIKPVRMIKGKTKVYKIQEYIYNLNSDWISFLMDKDYKNLCLKLLSGKKIDMNVLEMYQLELENSSDEVLNKTLGRLLYLYMGRAGFELHDLLEVEEIMEMDFFADGLSFGDETKDTNWRDLLSEEDKCNKSLMDVLEHYDVIVNEPTEKDIMLIKKAYIVCFPYQIRNAITNAKNHPKYGENFTSFNYIYKSVMQGRYGTRRNNKAKVDEGITKKVNSGKVNNQTDVGYKKSNLSRQEMMDVLLESSKGNSSDSDDGFFNFDLLRNR